MRGQFFGIVIAIACLLEAPAAAATPVTVQDLYQQCSSTSDIAAISCINYLEGITDMMELIGTVEENPSVPYSSRTALAALSVCRPVITGGQLRQVFVQWAEQNPKEWQNPKQGGAWLAIEKTWPCPYPKK